MEPLENGKNLQWLMYFLILGTNKKYIWEENESLKLQGLLLIYALDIVEDGSYS